MSAALLLELVASQGAQIRQIPPKSPSVAAAVEAPITPLYKRREKMRDASDRGKRHNRDRDLLDLKASYQLC